MASVTVEEILQDKAFDLNVECVAGHKGLHKQIKIPHVQKPGLALAGYTSFLVPNRMQVFGKTEITYLSTLSPQKRKEVFRQFFQTVDIACCVVTRNLEVPSELIEMADQTRTAVLRTSLLTQVFIERITKFLELKFAKTATLHGVLMDVFGIGILILGKSGIGKSECALDLVLRGHRLVADDIVELMRVPPASIYGHASEIIKHHMEIRGLGIINIKELFGISAVRDRKKVQLVVKLVDWEETVDYDRVGLDEGTYTVIGVELPLIVLPVRPGRNLTAIVEVAARNKLLKLEGYHAAREFQKNLLRQISNPEEPERLGEDVE